MDKIPQANQAENISSFAPKLLEGIRQQKTLARRLLEKGDVAQALEIAGLLLRKRELLRIALSANDQPEPISRRAEERRNAQSCAK